MHFCCIVRCAFALLHCVDSRSFVHVALCRSARVLCACSRDFAEVFKCDAPSEVREALFAACVLAIFFRFKTQLCVSWSARVTSCALFACACLLRFVVALASFLRRPWPSKVVRRSRVNDGLLVWLLCSWHSFHQLCSHTFGDLKCHQLIDKSLSLACQG